MGLSHTSLAIYVFITALMLSAIKRQGSYMKDQTKTLGGWVAAAQKAADAAEISAKAAMGVAVPTIAIYKFSFINEGRENPAAFYQYPKVRLELKNYGQSPAFLSKYVVSFSWGSDMPETVTSFPFDEEQVIDAGGIFVFGEVELGVLDIPPQNVVEDLVKGERHLTFSGWVSYKDVFGSPTRRLTFCKALYDYHPDPAKMIVLDPTTLNIWTDTSQY